uniref:NADH-ubiquinone oxidoreductase chain 2 n=1 Tax=Nierstraszella lineata TaxID=515354 RepID=A0A6H1PG76_9MOLL|nr:NADH dehydrogenase subunit 2 [Nierstraszella lineata]QIZ12578.1 NADH dehydrogenase subunit 2 [Nierstraszella lineata]
MLRFPVHAMFMYILFFGTFVSISSPHWFGIWLGLELNMMSFIPIIVSNGSSYEVESGMKYFLIQAIGSSLILFGSLFMYSLNGSWNFYNHTTINPIIFIAILLKLGAPPLHFWLPDVIIGMSWTSSLILLTWQKMVPLFLLATFFHAPSTPLTIICILSSIIGGVGGMNQTSLRPLLAYSSIGHMGWILCGVLLTPVYGLIYFFIYSTISCFIFFMLSSHELSNTAQSFSLFNWPMSDRLTFMVLLLSLAGLPPLTGFLAKFAILMSLSSLKWFSFAPILFIGSMMNLYYYLILIFCMLLSSPSWTSPTTSPTLKTLAIMFNFIGVVVLLLLPFITPYL